MFDLKEMEKHQGRAAELAADKTVKGQAIFTQKNSGDGPHIWSDQPLLTISVIVGDTTTEVGTISFSQNDHVKSKVLNFDLTAQVTGFFNTIELKAAIDKNFLEGNTSSEVELFLTVGGVTRLRNKYQTDLPMRHIVDDWLIFKPT